MLARLGKWKKKKDEDKSAKAPPLLKAIPIGHLKTIAKSRLWFYHDFEVGETVGKGTFSRVRVVKIKGGSDRTPMALKILKKSVVIQLKQVEHTKGEKIIMGMVEHPFIVNLLTTFQDETRLFILMEYVNGGELFSYLRKQGCLPNDHARFYASQVVLALAYMHRVNIAYRDVKPENVLIDCEGHSKLTDFGFAKVVEFETYTLCGTPDYVAPEMVKGQGHGKPVDWWAFGVLLFEMLAGWPPFSQDTAYATYQKILKGHLDYPRHFDVKAADLIKRLLEADVPKRAGSHEGGDGDDIKHHRWFKGLDWDGVLNRTVEVPFRPHVRSADDTSMFETYPDSAENMAAAKELSPEEKALFDGFTAELG